MSFEQKVPTWKAEGVEPTTALKENGFVAGYKPPADYFNYMFNRYSECLDELQDMAAKKDGTNATGVWGINITGNADSATKATQDGDGNVIADTYAEKETIALKSATGASISIADSKEAPMILNYAPVNLFNHSFATTTKSGITFTANANGTITANGTATENMEVSIGTHTFTDDDIGKTFCWSDNGISVNADINWNTYIFLNNINGVSAWRGLYRFVVEKAHNVVVKIYIAKGTVLENKVYRPMLEEGSTYHTYVPYTGYDIASCGKNLIGSVPKSTSGTRCSVEWNGDDVTVTSTASGAWIGYSCNTRGLKPNTKYTVSIEVEASTTNIYNGIQFGNKIKFGYGLSGTVTLTDTTDANGYIYLLFLVDNKLGGSSGDYAIFKNIMLEEGDTASGYEASKSSSVTINYETVFPVDGLESYDGLTNVLNTYSATMEVTYATNNAGQGVLKELETKAEKSIYGDTVVSLGRETDTTVGDYSFAFGKYETASGDYSCAFGEGNIASGDYSLAFGDNANATGNYSKAFGSFVEASGKFSSVHGEGVKASGIYSHAKGYGTTASGAYSTAEGYMTTALTNQHAQGHYNNTTNATANSTSGTSTGTAFVIGNGSSSDNTSNAFRVTGEGATVAKKAYSTTGADYAEFREWLDGNEDNEDRRGYFVTLVGKKIRKANAGEYIRGVVSALPSVIGNYDEEWMGRYIRDDFGAFITETFEYEDEVITGYTEDGEPIIETATKTGTKWKENPEYDKEKEYIPREERKEWDAVGMVGELSVRDDGTCKVNGYCKCADGGIATNAEVSEYSYLTPIYRVVDRVTENIVKIEI